MYIPLWVILIILVALGFVAREVVRLRERIQRLRSEINKLEGGSDELPHNTQGEDAGGDGD